MPLILPGNVASALGGAYEVANSCRFNDGDSAYMHKTPSSDGNRRTFTFSFWVKRGELTSHNPIAEVYSSGENVSQFYFNAGDQFTWYESQTSNKINLTTNAVQRDPNAWYHIVVKVDTTESTNTDRVKIYINNELQTITSGSNTYPDQNFQSYMNSTHDAIEIGRTQYNSNQFDGYLAEVCMIDGSALAPSSFGEADEDSPTIWKPIDVSGLTFGTNGFYLDFEDSANLGNDKNGGTDLTEVNLAATDQSTDTCTNNFATMNPLATGSNITLSEGNLVTLGNTSSDSGLATMTIPFAFSGKWYWEVKMTDATSDYPYMGIFDDWESVSDADLNGAGGAALAMDAYIRGGNTTLVKTGTNLTITAPADNDIIMFAIDRDNNKFYIGNNGTWYNSGDPTTGTTGTGSLFNLTANTITMFGIHEYNGSDSSVNFGSPAYANSSSVADANGYGDFEYTPPSGYLSLCTKNLGSSGG